MTSWALDKWHRYPSPASGGACREAVFLQLYRQFPGAHGREHGVPVVLLSHHGLPQQPFFLIGPCRRGIDHGVVDAQQLTLRHTDSSELFFRIKLPGWVARLRESSSEGNYARSSADQWFSASCPASSLQRPPFSWLPALTCPSPQTCWTHAPETLPSSCGACWGSDCVLRQWSQFPLPAQDLLYQLCFELR